MKMHIDLIKNKKEKKDKLQMRKVGLIFHHKMQIVSKFQLRRIQFLMKKKNSNKQKKI